MIGLRRKLDVGTKASRADSVGFVVSQGCSSQTRQVSDESAVRNRFGGSCGHLLLVRSERGGRKCCFVACGRTRDQELFQGRQYGGKEKE